MILLTIFCYGLLAVYEWIPLYKQKQWRELWINSVLTFFSFTIAVLLSLGIKIPSPQEPIQQAILLILRKWVNHA